MTYRAPWFYELFSNSGEHFHYGQFFEIMIACFRSWKPPQCNTSLFDRHPQMTRSQNFWFCSGRLWLYVSIVPSISLMQLDQICEKWIAFPTTFTVNSLTHQPGVSGLVRDHRQRCRHWVSPFPPAGRSVRAAGSSGNGSSCGRKIYHIYNENNWEENDYWPVENPSVTGNNSSQLCDSFPVNCVILG